MFIEAGASRNFAHGKHDLKPADMVHLIDADYDTFGKALNEFINSSGPILLEELDIEELAKISDRQKRLERCINLLPRRKQPPKPV